MVSGAQGCCLAKVAAASKATGKKAFHVAAAQAGEAILVVFDREPIRLPQRLIERHGIRVAGKHETAHAVVYVTAQFGSGISFKRNPRSFSQFARCSITRRLLRSISGDVELTEGSATNWAIMSENDGSTEMSC